MDRIEQTKACSDSIVGLLAQDKTLAVDIAIMGCLDAAVRIVKKAKRIDNVEAIITLENTLQAIREAEGG
jgi:hypothetical protein